MCRCENGYNFLISEKKISFLSYAYLLIMSNSLKDWNLNAADLPQLGFVVVFGTICVGVPHGTWNN